MAMPGPLLETVESSLVALSVDPKKFVLKIIREDYDAALNDHKHLIAALVTKRNEMKALQTEEERLAKRITELGKTYDTLVPLYADKDELRNADTGDVIKTVYDPPLLRDEEHGRKDPG